MPAYVYRCDTCGADTDAAHPINDDPIVNCSRCDATTTHRVPQLPRASFVGPGFASWDKRKFKTKSDPGPKSARYGSSERATAVDSRGMPYLDKNCEPMTIKEFNQNKHQINDFKRKRAQEAN